MTRTFESVAALAAAKGEEIGESDWVTVEQSAVNLFADATGDHQWIHVDPERAKDGPFGGPIAHGFLTLSLLPQLWSNMYKVDGVKMGINYGLNKVRFPSPVPVGARIRARSTVVEVEDLGNNTTQVTLSTAIEIDGAPKPACVAESIVRYIVLRSRSMTDTNETGTDEAGAAETERFEVTRHIDASPSAIFALLREPSGHVAIDSSGMLQSFTGAAVTAVGEEFTIHMDRESLNDLPMGKYDVRVIFTKYVEDELIEWTISGTVQPPLRHLYGYRLMPSGDGADVTSYYDWSEIDDRYRGKGVFPVIPENGLRATLGILARTLEHPA